MLKTASHYPTWSSVSSPVIPRHINKPLSVKIFVLFWLNLACISHVKASQPLSRQRHDHRNPKPFVYRRGACLWTNGYPGCVSMAWAWQPTLWHRGHIGRWQPNAFYCLPLPLVCPDRISHEHCRDDMTQNSYTISLPLSFSACSQPIRSKWTLWHKQWIF